VSEGELLVVATPIGNLGDLSPRAIDVLKTADLVCAEDTRHTGLMLRRLGVVPRRLLSVHAHNERQRVPEVLRELSAGSRVALVTDAGTPGVSDPGDRVVRAAIEAGFRVGVVPGPSAALAALVVSGLATERWCFEGFLPRQGRARSARLAAVAAETDRAVVLFEAPYRAARLLDDLAQACGGERPGAVCRELTKVHEEVWRGSLSDLAGRARAVSPRGEHVIVVGASPARL